MPESKQGMLRESKALSQSSTSLSILLAPFGSEGDVYPLVWAAKALAARGHRPRMLLSPHYSRLAEAAGVPWTPVGREEDFEAMVRDVGFWHPLSGPARVMQAMVDTFPEFLRAWHASGPRPDLVVISSLGLAVACAAEAEGVPRLTIHMQPAVFLSSGDCPVFAHGTRWLVRLPSPLKRLTMHVISSLLDRLLRRRLNTMRASMHLPPWRSVYSQGLMGGQGIGLMAPSWFAPAQPGWPPSTRQFGFPLPDGTPPDLNPALEDFLNKHPSPVVWTHGSANFDTSRYWGWAIRASLDAGVPFVLVGPSPPGELPPSGFHTRHAPFDALFPRAGAVAHHGGIGTTAKAIAAGLPQLVIPRAHDQPDNASRVERLGLGLQVPYPFGSASRTFRALRQLLASADIQKKCSQTRNRPDIAADPATFAVWVEETFMGTNPAEPVLRAGL